MLTSSLIRQECVTSIVELSHRQAWNKGKRALVLQQKTQRPVQFEITEQTRSALNTWITHTALQPMAVAPGFV